MCFCFVPCAGSCGARRRVCVCVCRYFCTRGWVSCVFPFLGYLSMAPVRLGCGRETLQKTKLAQQQPITSLLYVPPCLLSFLYFSFLFSCHTQPANAMRQLFQTTISLCGRGCGSHTVLFSFFLSSSSSVLPSLFALVTPLPPSPPRGRRSFSCVTAQSRYMRKCVHACVHTWKGVAHDNGVLCFSNLPPSFFSSPSLAPSAVSTRLPLPAPWGQRVVAGGINNHPPPSTAPPWHP